MEYFSCILYLKNRTKGSRFYMLYLIWGYNRSQPATQNTKKNYVYDQIFSNNKIYASPTQAHLLEFTLTLTLSSLC